MLLHVGAFLTMASWGASFVQTRVLLDNGMGPAAIYFWRFLLAYLLTFCFCHKRLLSASVKDELLFMMVGFVSGPLYFIAENTALEYTLATNVSLITSLSPVITAMLVGALYKSERPGRGYLLGSMIAFLGVGCVIFNSSFVFKMNPMGDVLSLVAAVVWSVYSLLLRRLYATYSAMFISRKAFFYGVVTSIPFVLMESNPSVGEMVGNAAVLGNLLFLGVVASMFGYVVWAQAIGKLGTVKASTYLYFQPLITMVASAIVLGERVTAVGYVGCGLIIGGVWLSDSLERRRIKRQ